MSSTTSSASPQRFPYLFRNVADFPRRLFHPPQLSVPRVGTVRSLTLKPCYKVSLEDVLNGRHLPPLGRKEFEDFLYFKEYSVENLYFYVWFISYQAEWSLWATNANANGNGDLKPNPKLAMSYARAKETFFTSGSPWELNLPQRTLQQLLQPQTPHPGPSSHPHPNALAEVRFEVNNYLSDSLTRFIVQNGGNSGRYRGLFAVSLGLIVIGIGLIPIVLNSLARDHTWQQKLNRLASLPALWFGFATLIMGLHGVCILIFLFGDARQLYPYELRRPNISSPICCAPTFALNPNLIANNNNTNSSLHPNKRQDYPPNTRRPTSLAALALDTQRRRSSVPVTISPQKERHDRTEFVHLPGAPPSETSTAALPPSIEGDHHHHHRHADKDDAKRRDDSVIEIGPRRDLGHHACVKIFKLWEQSPTTATTATFVTPLYPDLPLAFDFDALPIPPTMRVPDWKAPDETNSSPTAPSSFTAWQQHVGTNQPYSASATNDSATSTKVKSTNSNGGTSSSTSALLRRKYHAMKQWEWNKERAVFSPLTRVLDPIVTRVQWEIVMRSSLFALVISLVIALGSLGLP
ncbi:hypothetical protein M408DRAFT_15021 [Serendipita vermifera MAFF 305830]|uniref:RGS domain-containing protein n=1 Tax=Serendipita vermifera MAFF 305830 TaxID=933852 RepID=A0A0C3B5G5_SERVB|nr:hypothetical protein M408DRAFT_15021 [Serendipita vermifera MAFF 305830]